MKKIQVFMEFLMTYGWAILVVLVAIGALAYFGILSPERFMPDCVCDGCSLSFVENGSIQYNIVECCYKVEWINETHQCDKTYQKSYLPVIGGDVSLDKYCVEWDGWIQLEDMVYNCYNFEKQEVKCMWSVESDNRLWVYEPHNLSNNEIYNCSKYVESYEVD